MEVDSTEQIAGNTALQEAAGSIAERMCPKLVSKGDEKSAKEKEKKAMSLLQTADEPAFRIGTVVAAGRKAKSRVIYLGVSAK